MSLNKGICSACQVELLRRLKEETDTATMESIKRDYRYPDGDAPLRFAGLLHTVEDGLLLSQQIHLQQQGQDSDSSSHEFLKILKSFGSWNLSVAFFSRFGHLFRPELYVLLECSLELVWYHCDALLSLCSAPSVRARRDGNTQMERPPLPTTEHICLDQLFSHSDNGPGAEHGGVAKQGYSHGYSCRTQDFLLCSVLRRQGSESPTAEAQT